MDVLEEVVMLKDSRHIADRVARIILSAAQYPEFGIGGVPIVTAAEVYGKDPTWVRQGIEDGWLPIGHMTRSGNKRIFLYPLRSYGKILDTFGKVNYCEN
ncbi:hypothetical protein [Lacrimispora amygdalina]|uniref:hypothetical protein n=1 Tax=Lacrimispora amygdalina TaxID=253257 RepID=UPI002E8E3A25|nr:hypothetical protein [Lacrimispora amygdalina]